MKVLLGMPCMRTIPYQTTVSLLRTCKKGVVDACLVEGSLVYDSRDHIAKVAVNEGYDYVLFADSDMVFNADDLNKLMSHNTDIVSGYYVSRNGENNPVVYTKIITRRQFPFRSPELIRDNQVSGYGPAAACGFGFCLIKTSVFKSMFKRYKSLFEPKWGVGEDAAFCIRARKCGYEIFCDRDVKLGHVGQKVYE